MRRVLFLLGTAGTLCCVPEIRVQPRQDAGLDALLDTGHIGVDTPAESDLALDVLLPLDGGALEDRPVDQPAPDVAEVGTGDVSVFPDRGCGPCVLAHATTTCTDGNCSVERCEAGYSNCNSIVGDGCETSLNSPTSCGACGRTCETGICMRASCLTQRSCPIAGERGCGLTAIMGGSFAMGSADVDVSYGAPVGPVRVSDFAVDSFEVTVSRFRRFWEAGHPRPSGPVRYPNARDLAVGSASEPEAARSGGQCNWSASPGSRESHPLNCMNWATAQAFCVWDGGRLPTEAELEYVGRGRDIPGIPVPRNYPWGNEEIPLTWPTSPKCARAQFQYCSGDDGAVTRRVGSFAASGGVFDLAGNVMELVADDWSFSGAAPCWDFVSIERVDPLCTDDNERRAGRGGSYGVTSRSASLLASRVPRSATGGDRELGFRCVRSP